MQLAWAVIVPIEPVPQSLLWPLRRRQRQRAKVSLDWSGLRAVLHGGPSGWWRAGRAQAARRPRAGRTSGGSLCGGGLSQPVLPEPEAHLGGRWVIFDATRLSDLDGLVRVARRRDAKDLALAMI